LRALDVLPYIAFAGLIVAVATRFYAAWFVRSRARRVVATALLVIASVWGTVTVTTAIIGASFYGWGDPAIIWPSILLLALVVGWLVRQTLWFYDRVGGRRLISG
jgi:hypothetical protein